ncbi:MAG: rhombotarget lipoprotein [Steroidobacteraceae bacterium]
MIPFGYLDATLMFKVAQNDTLIEIPPRFLTQGSQNMKIRYVAMMLIAAYGLSGCVALDHVFYGTTSQVHNSSSLVSFLYPDGKVPPVDNAIPKLPIPLRVGLAFLPSQTADAMTLNAAQKAELLQRIHQRFADRKFVAEIVEIPDYYLKTNRGFAGLQGVQRLYNIDVMALVSYDQMTYQDDNKLSLGYMTIVGAFILKGTSRDTSTLVDLAVIDPITHSLILRAGGTDTRHGNSTLVDLQRDSRLAGADSFSIATDQMITNFDAALTRFETDVRAGKANVQVVNRSTGASGGGAMGSASILALLSLFLLRRAHNARDGSLRI